LLSAGSAGFVLVNPLAPGFPFARQDQVKDDGNHCAQGDAFQLAQRHVADTKDQGHAYDHQITGL